MSNRDVYRAAPGFAGFAKKLLCYERVDKFVNLVKLVKVVKSVKLVKFVTRHLMKVSLMVVKRRLSRPAKVFFFSHITQA